MRSLRHMIYAQITMSIIQYYNQNINFPVMFDAVMKYKISERLKFKIDSPEVYDAFNFT